MAEIEDESLTNECKACGTSIEVSGFMPFEEVACPSCGELMRVRVIFDHYEIREMRGVGGMSQVFVAIDSHLNRAVALKVLNRENSSKQDRILQFEREARLTASINHQNVVRVYSVGHAQGNFYIAMELVEGDSLEEILREQNKLSEVQVLDLAIQATEGLAAAHRVGLIHRDIKPGNILLTSEGKAKLVDFGLALVFEKDVDDSDEMWATPYYVPPEKLAGLTEDFRSDIYSLGSTLFHLLAGRPPYDTPTSSIDELREIKSRPVRLGAFAPMISGATQQVVNRMIEIKPAERFQSYDELLEGLRDARQLLLASLGMIQQVTRQTRREEIRRRRAWQMGAGAVVLTLAVISLVVWHALSKPPPVTTVDGGDAVADENYNVDTVDSNNVGERFLKARQLLVGGKLPEARAEFLAIFTDNRTRQPTVNWAAYNVALADLLADSPGEAREIMRQMKESPRFQQGRSSQYGPLFLLTAEKMLAPGPFPVGQLEEMKKQRGWETQVLLLGLKNWQHGRFKDAVAFIDAARQSKLPQEFAWIRDLDPVLGKYGQDLVTLNGLDTSDDFVRSGEVASAITETRTALAQLRTGGRAKRWLEARIAALEKTRAKLAAGEQQADKENLDKKTTAELAALATLSNSLPAFRDGYRFEEAVNEIRAAAVTTPAARDQQSKMLWLQQGCAEFFAVLVEDLNAKPFKGSFQPREGAVVYQNVTITKATRANVIVSGPIGVVNVPVATIPVAQLNSMAVSMLERTTGVAETNRRRGLLARFNHVMGNAELAKRWAAAIENDKEFAGFWKALVPAAATTTP